MQPPLFVRPLTAEECSTLEAGLRSSNAFTLRRSQILLASARQQGVREIAQMLGCCRQTVRNTIRAFNQSGSVCLKKQSCAPKSVQPILDESKCERLKDLLHQSPRTFGKPTSVWTLGLAAEVSYEQGLTQQQVSDETIRRALKRLGTHWKRAKHWISSPDPAYTRKKSGESA